MEPSVQKLTDHLCRWQPTITSCEKAAPVEVVPQPVPSEPLDEHSAQDKAEPETTPEATEETPTIEPAP
jgi:hypothetical protein